MRPPPRARSVTPAPTVPPPSRPPTEPPVERIARRVETTRALVAIAVILLAAGGSAWKLYADKADVGELDQVRTGAAAALGAAQANTSAQLGTLQATVQDLRAHQAAVDAKVDALTSAVDRLGKTADVLYIQLVEVSRATGARQVPAAPPPDATGARP